MHLIINDMLDLMTYSLSQHVEGCEGFWWPWQIFVVK